MISSSCGTNAARYATTAALVVASARTHVNEP
jgi:hypothetical protein